MKYGNLTLGQIEAGVNKIGGEEAFLKLLRGELTVSEPVRRWMEKDGVIYFSVVSDGTTGPQWIRRLEKKDFRLSKWAKDVLNSPNFKPTNGTIYNCAVIKGEFFSDENRITSKIRAEADGRKFTKPNAEVACLIRENFSDEEIEAMGLWWLIIMHKPINDSDGDPLLLGANRYDEGRWLNAYYDRPDNRWNRENGFVFLAPLLSSFLSCLCGRVLF